METFAEKIIYGKGTRLDPLLEEKGGWISWEAPKQDVEMADAVIEVMTEANQRTSKDVLNLFRAQSGEILPSNLEKSISGFLVKKDAVMFKVDPQNLLAHTTMMENQLVIEKIVGSKPNS